MNNPKLIKEEIFNKAVDKNFVYEFSIGEKGVYAIEISARCKNWLQNTGRLISFFKDDNLAIVLNGLEFTKLSGKTDIFDGEAAWNGNKLKNLRQTNIFISHLLPGKQKVGFNIKQKPFIEFIKIYQIESTELNVKPELGYQPENANSNSRPYLVIISAGVRVNKVKVSASADKEKGKDDQDLQIKIDGKIEVNSTPKSHKNWYWCGGVLKGENKIFESNVNFVGGVHYIEFWADQNPQIGELLLTLDSSERTPSLENPLWTGDFNDDPDEILLARMIFGEARNQSDEARIWVGSTVFNRKNSSSNAWPKTIKDVILQPKQYKSFSRSENNKNNFSQLINPAQNPSQKDVWEKCYGISIDLISGKTLIGEVTHFHDESQSQKSFMKSIVPNGKFLKKIGHLYFYYSLD